MPEVFSLAPSAHNLSTMLRRPDENAHGRVGWVLPTIGDDISRALANLLVSSHGFFPPSRIVKAPANAAGNPGAPCLYDHVLTKHQRFLCGASCSGLARAFPRPLVFFCMGLVRISSILFGTTFFEVSTKMLAALPNSGLFLAGDFSTASCLRDDIPRPCGSSPPIISCLTWPRAPASCSCLGCLACMPRRACCAWGCVMCRGASRSC